MHRRARKTPLPRLLNPGDVIAGKWKVNQCIGVGAFYCTMSRFKPKNRPKECQRR